MWLSDLVCVYMGERGRNPERCPSVHAGRSQVTLSHIIHQPVTELHYFQRDRQREFEGEKEGKKQKRVRKRERVSEGRGERERESE